MNNSYLINKKVISIVLWTLLFTGCNSFNNHQANSILSNENIQSCFPKRAINKNPNMDGLEDTLCFKIDGINFNIFPNGLLCWGTSKADTIRLTTDMFVEKAYFIKIDSSLMLFCEESDSDYGTSEMFNLNLQEKKIKWKANIKDFNLGQPIVRGDFVYLTTLGSVAKFDLKRRKYVYKYSNLYDNQDESFNNFNTIVFKNNLTYFLSQKHTAANFDSVIVDEKENKMTVKIAVNNNLKIQKPQDGVISQWIFRNLGLKIDNSKFIKAKLFNTSNYSRDLKPEIKSEFGQERWINSKTINDIKVNNGNVCIDIGIDDCNKILFITEKYIIISIHYVAGSNGGTLIYDLEKQTLFPMRLTVDDIISDDELNVSNDYYENRETAPPTASPPPVHVFESGIYNIKSGKYKMTYKEI